MARRMIEEMNVGEISLPAQFNELQRFVAKWDRRGQNERYKQRLGSTIEELQDFHDVVRARGDEVKAYLDSKPLVELTEEDRCLGRLMFAWVPVAEAVQVFKQPRVPDSKMYWDFIFEPDL